MALMTSARRPLALAVLAALVLPVLAMPFVGPETTSHRENRRLALPPKPPRTLEDWRGLPRRLDAYLADHFAFREPLIAASARMEQAAGGRMGRRDVTQAAAKAVTGRDGQMFLVEGLLESTGQQVDRVRAADYAAFVCEAGARLEARGIKVLASIAPSPGEIIPELAPDWAGPASRPTEYDLVLAGLNRCEVAAIDLRPTLVAAKPQGRLYRKLDTHWTQRGALVAYGRVVQALGRPDWTVTSRDVTWGVADNPGGDLPRMANVEPPAERVEIYGREVLPPGAVETRVEGLTLQAAGQSAPPVQIETGKPGPSVLIVGDSYTASPFFPPLFARFAGKVAWIHIDQCAFDWRVIDRVKPDYVLIMPAEREAFCLGARPWKGR